MLSIEKYNNLRILKCRGYNKTEIARELRVSRGTVGKFYAMPEGEFLKNFYEKNRFQALRVHIKDIEKWIKRNKKITVLQIRKRLFDKFNETYSERTVSRFIEAMKYSYVYRRLWEDEEQYTLS